MEERILLFGVGKDYNWSAKFGDGFKLAGSSPLQMNS